MSRGRFRGPWSPRRARRAAAAWLVVVVLASVVDPAAVGSALGGTASAAGDTGTGVPVGIDGYTLAHVVAYGVLAWLVSHGIDREQRKSGGSTLRTAILVVAVATAAGGAVELLQTGVAARSGSVADAAVNGIGAIVGVVARSALRGDSKSKKR
ncbi:VanZ family protein [Halobellus ordinarius]|uniref:VanZ family protein n=1 Tax=Halobellus ordinarius TaxID=3075120 RepID=UPI0028808892|nr:VanZ family protein [Halobellus sp. ZY16]